MTTYEKYLEEAKLSDMVDTREWWQKGDEGGVDPEMGLTAEDLYKLKSIAVRVGLGVDQLPLAKRVVEKVYQGMTVSNDKEKAVLTAIMKFFLSPEKARFKTILSKF